MTDYYFTTKLKEKLEGFIISEDPLLEMMKLLLGKIIEIEVSQIVGATKGEHSKERKTHLSGTRPRQFDTRLGTIDLKIPKVRNGGYVPFFVNTKQRSEKALIQVVLEAWVKRIYTRNCCNFYKALESII